MAAPDEHLKPGHCSFSKFLFESRLTGHANIADSTLRWYVHQMETLQRIGALDIAEAIAGRIGSYVDMNFIQFLAVEQDRVLCWYMNCDGDGPTFEITLARAAAGWSLELTEHAPGNEQQIELP